LDFFKLSTQMSLSHRLGLPLLAHHRVFAAFFLYAFSMGGFYPRLAEIQRGMGVGESTLGLALIGVASGTLFSLTFLAPLLERFGARMTLLTLPPCVALVYAVASHMQSSLALFGVLFLGGLCLGCLETIVNLEADRVEHQLGRRIMNRSHAFWSFGFFGASAFSALASRLQINAQWQLSLTVPLVLLLTLLLMGRFEAAPSRHVESGNAAPRWSLPTAGIMLLVACCASALLLEGAGIDWSAIYMRDVFQSGASVSALAVSAVALAQACTRFVADALVERWAPVPVARGLLSVLFVGALLVSVAPQPAFAILGFAMIGVGSSAIFPLAMSAAAQRTDRPAAVNVAALAQTGFVIFLLAPPSLGFVAEYWGIRSAYGVCLPLVLLGLLSCSALAPQARSPQVNAASRR
jgi:MFS family permease